MAELLVVIGVIAIVVSLLLPSLGGAMARARLTRDMEIVRQAAIVSTQYLSDFDEVFPTGHRNGHACEFAFAEDLVRGGYISSIQAIDPEGAVYGPEVVGIRVTQSKAMSIDPDLMTPGRTRPVELVETTFTKLSSCIFPSNKMWLGLHTLKNSDMSTYFCCVGSPTRVPMSFVDVSVEVRNKNELLWHAPEITVIDSIGVPGFATWGGIRARDK